MPSTIRTRTRRAAASTSSPARAPPPKHCPSNHPPEGAREMSPLKRSNNIAARMGRWSASHWKTAVFGWLVLVALAFMVGGKIGTKNTSDADSIVGEAHHADQILR